MLALTGCSPAKTALPPAPPPLVIPRVGGNDSLDVPSSEVRFGHVPPTVGARWTVDVEARGTPNDEQSGSEVSSYSATWTVEVLAMDGPAITRARMKFGRCVQEWRGTETPRSITDHSYVVDATGPDVVDEQHGNIDANEATAVLNLLPDLGTRTQIDQLMPDKPMAIGESRPELAGAVVRVMHPTAWTLVRGTAVLARIEAGEAVFDVTLVATSSTFRIDLAGDVKLRLKDVRLTAISLVGAYEVVSGANKSDGRFSYRRTVRDL
jgi:hypothetical protein